MATRRVARVITVIANPPTTVATTPPVSRLAR